MSKPLDQASSEALMNLCAEHGLEEVLGFIADLYANWEGAFEGRPMTACLKVAAGLAQLAESAKAADAELS
jgi:hypothetical protein